MILIKKILRFIVNFILIFILLFSSSKVISKLNEYRKADNIYHELQLKKNNTNSDDEVNSVVDLSDINSDYVAWIEIPNTNIDYPIVQSDNNSYYLNRDIYKNYLASGSIFMDYRNDNFSDKNTVIYGHYMRNNTMFGQLKKFKEKDFFNENNIIKIYKPSGEILEYKVFSAYTTSASDNYIQTYFNSDEDYKEFLNKIIDKSLFKSDESVNIDDNILTLSTCSYDFKDARMVVHAKLIN